MKVTVKFNMDSAAFYDNPQHEVTNVMSRAIDKILNTPCGPCGFQVPLLDTNGNTVGSVRVVEDGY